MAAIDLLRGLLGRSAAVRDDRPTRFVYVALPQPLEPDEREERFARPLDVELRLTDAGFVSGGGTLIDLSGEEGDDEEPRIIHVGIDVDAYDLDRARGVLHEHLPPLGCAPGTRIEYEDGGAWEDLFTGARWVERRPRAPDPEGDGDGRA